MSLSLACLLCFLGLLIHTIKQARIDGGKFSFLIAYIVEHLLGIMLSVIGLIILMVLWATTGVKIPLPEALGGEIVLVQGEYTMMAPVLGYLSLSIMEFLFAFKKK